MTEDIRSRIGLRPVINVSGTMTSLGASIVIPEAVEAMAAILPQFVEINDLQRKASAVISRLTGGEAGFVTASCSSGISLAVAGAITGNNLLAIEKLPDVTPEKNEVLVQMGHVVSYGAPVDQAIRLGGGKVVLIGQATSTHRFHMENAITEKTAAAVYVVSHHVVDYGLLHLSEFVEIAHARGIPVLIDGSQGAVHQAVDVQALEADFYVMTGHKLYGPTGIGVLYGKYDLLAEMQPYQGGGEMIDVVTMETVTYNEPPHRFEAGTPPIVQAIGLGAAIDYVEGIGREAISAHEADLTAYGTEKLSRINSLRLIGNAPGKGGIFSFEIEGAHAHDVSTILDRYGIAVRAGTHCAMPLLKRFGVTSTCRASLGLYSGKDDIDALVEGIEKARTFFR